MRSIKLMLSFDQNDYQRFVNKNSLAINIICLKKMFH